jgi:hypothetical protein
MVVELSHKVVVSFTRWLFREVMTSFSLLALSHPHHQKSYVALHGTTYGTADVYQCTCSYHGLEYPTLLIQSSRTTAVVHAKTAVQPN